MAAYTRRNKKSHKKLILFTVLIIIIAIGGLLLWHHNNNKLKQVKISGGNVAIANPNVPGGSNTGSAGSGNNSTIPPANSNNSKDDGSNTVAATLAPGIQPVAPTGQFVSDHSVTTNEAETSTCSTTPGALCEIEFTNGFTTKDLAKQLTDENGNTIWSSWTSASIGLTNGNWTITALAINGSKTASTKDATGPLVVQ